MEKDFIGITDELITDPFISLKVKDMIHSLKDYVHRTKIHWMTKVRDG